MDMAPINWVIKRPKLDLLTSVKDFFLFSNVSGVSFFSRPVWQLVALKKKKKKEKVVLAWAHILKSHSQQTFHSEQLDPLLQPSSKVSLVQHLKWDSHKTKLSC